MYPEYNRKRDNDMNEMSVWTTKRCSECNHETRVKVDMDEMTTTLLLTIHRKNGLYELFYEPCNGNDAEMWSKIDYAREYADTIETVVKNVKYYLYTLGTDGALEIVNPDNNSNLRIHSRVDINNLSENYYFLEGYIRRVARVR